MFSIAYVILEMSVLVYATGFICSLLGHLSCAKMTLALLLPINFCQNSLAQGIQLRIKDCFQLNQFARDAEFYRLL